LRDSAGKSAEFFTLKRGTEKLYSDTACFLKDENGLTNGRTEGFNRVAKLIQRNAYGFRNFENYRKRLIYKTS